MGPVLFIFACVAHISCVESQSACTTSTGDRGECISIKQCDPLLALLNKKDKTNQDVDTLKQSQCGFRSSAPQVCCPSQCFTIEGELGKCIGIMSCPHLAALLKPPITAEITSYIRSSRCEGPDKYSVCCGQNISVRSVQPARACEVSAALPDPRTECCGPNTLTARKVFVGGGNLTDIDQYPWLTVIEYKKDKITKLLCGGALISGKYVLTAGHCVIGSILRNGPPVNVRLGEYDTENEGPDCRVTDVSEIDCTEGAVVIPIERSIPHPEYDPDSTFRQHDIALLRLTQLAVYTDFIRPIRLPTSDLTLNPPSPFTLYVAGWGAVGDLTPSSNIKLHVDLPFRSLESCQLAYRTFVPKSNVSLWNRQLCAGGVSGKDSCKGDSGGPLMYFNDNRNWEATGVISFGTSPCGIENVPGVYTNVYHYMPWIRSQIKP